MSNTSSFVEKQIADYLCKKHYYELNNHWKKLIKMMFPLIMPNDIIYCEDVKMLLKQDVFIVATGIKKTISIKSGKDATLHCETLEHFCSFLKYLKVNDYDIETLKLYHYGDGTIDGTGEKREHAEALKLKYMKRIQTFNTNVNKPYLLREIIDRFLSCGTLNQCDKVDYLYYGNFYEGGLYDMNDLINFFSIQHVEKIRGIHFGTFHYTAYYRFITSKNTDERDRHYIAIKWFGYEIDLDKFVKYRKIKNRDTNHISSSFEL